MNNIYVSKLQMTTQNLANLYVLQILAEAYRLHYCNENYALPTQGRLVHVGQAHGSPRVGVDRSARQLGVACLPGTDNCKTLLRGC